MTILQHVREGMTERLNEAREIFSKIRQEESSNDEIHRPNFFSSTLRGLTYISLYGAIEYTVTNGTQGFINHLCGLNLNTKHLEHSLNSIAFHPQLQSAEAAQAKKKWRARREIFKELDRGRVFETSDTVFGTFLYNVYPETVSEVFLCLGIDRPPTLEDRHLGYFKEITEKRNAIAHGRESAASAGSNLTHQDIENRLNTTHSISSYFLDTLENHATELQFIRGEHRSMYLS